VSPAGEARALGGLATTLILDRVNG
jgi:hypothetical protein